MKSKARILFRGVIAPVLVTRRCIGLARGSTATELKASLQEQEFTEEKAQRVAEAAAELESKRYSRLGWGSIPVAARPRRSPHGCSCCSQTRYEPLEAPLMAVEVVDNNQRCDILIVWNRFRYWFQNQHSGTDRVQGIVVSAQSTARAERDGERQ